MVGAIGPKAKKYSSFLPIVYLAFAVVLVFLGFKHNYVKHTVRYHIDKKFNRFHQKFQVLFVYIFNFLLVSLLYIYSFSLPFHSFIWQ